VYNPDKDAARQAVQLGDLDRRIAQLEGAMGLYSDKVGCCGSHCSTLLPTGARSHQTTGFPDVGSALQYLQRRLELLTQDRLDAGKGQRRAEFLLCASALTRGPQCTGACQRC
jgi:hypothetical protein